MVTVCRRHHSVCGAQCKVHPASRVAWSGSGIAPPQLGQSHEANYMICSLKFWKNIGLSTILLGGMAIMTGPAQARSFSSRGNIFSAQKRLQMKGYYRGPLNGRYNRRTMRALTDFQFDHNLAQTGRLNPKTCRRLGTSCGITRSK